MGWLYDEDEYLWGHMEGPAIKSKKTAAEKKAEDVKYECDRINREYFARLRMATEPLVEHQFTARLLVHKVPAKYKDRNADERDRWLEWARKRHPEWGANPKPPRRLAPDMYLFTPPFEVAYVVVYGEDGQQLAASDVKRANTPEVNRDPGDWFYTRPWLPGSGCLLDESKVVPVSGFQPCSGREEWKGGYYDWSTFHKTTIRDVAYKVAAKIARKVELAAK